MRDKILFASRLLTTLCTARAVHAFSCKCRDEQAKSSWAFCARREELATALSRASRGVSSWRYDVRAGAKVGAIARPERRRRCGATEREAAQFVLR